MSERTCYLGTCTSTLVTANCLADNATTRGIDLRPPGLFNFDHSMPAIRVASPRVVSLLDVLLPTRSTVEVQSIYLNTCTIIYMYAEDSITTCSYRSIHVEVR